MRSCVLRMEFYPLVRRRYVNYDTDQAKASVAQAVSSHAGLH